MMWKAIVSISLFLMFMLSIVMSIVAKHGGNIEMSTHYLVLAILKMSTHYLVLAILMLILQKD